MMKLKVNFRSLVNLFGLISVLKDFFYNEDSLKKIYRVLMGGLIAYIVGKTAYMSYKVFKQGFVKEIHRRIEDDDDNIGYEADRPEFQEDSPSII
jgi:hypothetical protein